MVKTNKKKSKNNLIMISTIFGVIILIMGFFIYNGYRKYLLSKDIVCSVLDENSNKEKVLTYIYNDEGKLDYLVETMSVVDNTENHNFYLIFSNDVEQNPKKFKGVYATISELNGSNFDYQYIFDLNNMNSDDLKEFFGISVKELQSKSKNYIKKELYVSFDDSFTCK